MDPDRVFTIPGYQLRELIVHLDGVEADRLRQATTAATLPHTKASDYRAFLRSLEARTRNLYPRPKAQPMEKVGHDPEAAAAWFAARGIVTETTSA